MIFADVSFNLCDDALELLKMSSIFQKIEDNNLSMSIIRAYDTCGVIESSVNGHIDSKDSRLEYSYNGDIRNLKVFLRSKEGSRSISWLSVQPDPASSIDVTDVEAAISAIDDFLGRKRLIPKEIVPPNPDKQ